MEVKVKKTRMLLPLVLALGWLSGSLPATAQPDEHSPNVQQVDFEPHGATNTDLAFWGDRLYAGDTSGFRIFDISNPANPTLVNDFACPGSQHDISVWNNDADADADLLFLSIDTIRTNETCASTTATAAQAENGWEGVRIFDINNELAPTLIAGVPLDCGAHTHTMVPTDDGIGAPAADTPLYIYVSSYPLSGQTNQYDFEANNSPNATVGADQAVGQRQNGTECLEPEPRPDTETGGWEANEFHNKISIINVNLSNPAAADDAVAGSDCDGAAGPADQCVSYPAVFEWPMPLGTQVTHLQLGAREVSIVACHDIAVFIELDLAAGSCWDETQLWDITNPANPDFLRRKRNHEVDLIFHSVTFSWDGKTLALEDEAGGGTDDRCRDPNDLQGRMWFYDTSLRELGSFKIPRAQPPNPAPQICTAHNYTIIPQTDDRDILVSGWYQGGTSVIDMTDPAAAEEIGFYDLAGISGTGSNSWSSYWYNGFIYVNDIGRGLETLAFNDARKENAVTLPFFNPQTQMNVIPQNRPTCQGQPATKWGTSQPDTLSGTDGADVIVGQGGNDVIDGTGGADVVCAGDGDDQVTGAGGDDQLFGESGNDVLTDTTGNDRASGGVGNDRLRGGANNDRLAGNEGKDRLFGQSGKDRLNGGPQKDRCNGGPQRDKGRACEKKISIP
jgi:hypothetical protein